MNFKSHTLALSAGGSSTTCVSQDEDRALSQKWQSCIDTPYSILPRISEVYEEFDQSYTG